MSPVRPALPLLLLLLLVAAPGAHALGMAGPAGAGGLAAARAEVAAARGRLEDVRARHGALQAELGALDARIAALKGRRARGALVAARDGELQAALRRSQELSDGLTALLGVRAAAEAELEARAAGLEARLTEELARLRAAWQGAPREQRPELLARMRTLRAERDGVRAGLPRGAAPAVPGLAGDAVDDPEALLEQAEAVRDAEDRVRARLAGVRARLAQVREERELDRRLGDFLDDEAVFDERDRRLAVRRGADGRLQADRPRTGGSAAFESGDTAAPGAGAEAPDSRDGPGAGSPVASPAPPSAPSTNAPPAPTSAPAESYGQDSAGTGVRGEDARPSVGAPRRPRPSAAGGDELAQLEAEAARLEADAAALGARARALEARGREAQ